MNRMKKFIVVNNTYEETKKIVEYIVYRFEKAGFQRVKKDPDFVLVLGGDGTFLDACERVNYNSKVLFVGINFGNLGYLLDVSNTQIEELIQYLANCKEEELRVDEIKLLEVKVHYNDTSRCSYFYATNDICFYGNNFSKNLFRISTDNRFSQEALASGLLIATPTGSTGMSKSNSAPIILSDEALLVLSYILPIHNAHTKDFIPNPLIYHMFSIELLNTYGNLNITIDGKMQEELALNSQSIKRVDVKIGDKKIRRLNFSSKTFGEKIVEKMIRK